MKQLEKLDGEHIEQHGGKSCFEWLGPFSSADLVEIFANRKGKKVIFEANEPDGDGPHELDPSYRYE